MAVVEANGIEGLEALIGKGIGPGEWRENRARFPAPVPAGSRARAKAEIASVEEVGGGWWQVVTRFTVEVEGSDKPCCVADSGGRALVA